MQKISAAPVVPIAPPPSYAASQFQPPTTGATYDGHFVGANDPVAKRLIEEFIGTAATTARAEVRR